MSLDDANVVDVSGLEVASDTVVLTILDSWDWTEERRHLVALQAKLNSYFGFIETGQIYEVYPDARGKALRIDVIARHSIPHACADLLNKANEVAGQLKVEVRHKVLPTA